MTTNTPSPRRIVVLASVATALLLGAGPLAAQRTAAPRPSAGSVPAKADTATIMHLLNRITFGARPGDVERVRTMGLPAFIEQQLHPERIADTVLDTRLAEFPTLKMSMRELNEKYFMPAQELKRDQDFKNARAAAQAAKTEPKTADPDPSMAGGTTMAPTPATPARPQAALSPEQQQVQRAQANVTQELMQGKMIRGVMSERQLEEVLTDFWFNHFNVFVGKGQVRQYLTSYERDAIKPYVLGSFRDMLGATAHSPAMLFYLDNFQSSAPQTGPTMNQEMLRRLNAPRQSPQQRQQLMQRLEQAKRPGQRGLNENYARELMELHTLGVDGGYTQKDVIEVARALTGWTIDRPQAGGEFVFRPQQHDTGAKTILGVQFPKGGGQDEGERVLDILAKHPNTAHHIAFQLAQRFVADEPPATLVDRAAKVFLDTKGDLREVTRTIITSPEFFDSDMNRAKVKTPLEFVISALRATNATVTNAQPLVNELRTLGMPLYGCQPPTGYSMTADAWVNTGSLLTRMNFALSVVTDGGRGMQVDGRGRGGQPPPALTPQQQQRLQQGAAGAPGRGRGPGPGQLARLPIQVDVASLAPDTTEASRDRLVELLLGGRVSDGTMKTLARAENPQQLIALALGSPEFQRR